MHAEAAYMFVHAVTRDAAYQLQLPTERAQLHSMALRILEQLHPHLPRAIAADLARHARAAQLEAGDAALSELVAKELRYSIAAGDHCRYEYDLRSAETHYRHVFDHPRASKGHRASVFARCASVKISMGQPAPTLAWIDEHSGSIGMNADVYETRASALMQLGRAREAAADCRQSLEMLSERGGRRESQLLSLLCSIETDLGHEEAAVAAGDRAIELARIANDADAEAQAANNRGLILVARGRWVEATPLFRRAVVLSHAAGNLRVECTARGGLGSCLMNAGRIDEAECELGASARIARRLGNLREEGVAITNLATAWEWRADLERAAYLYRQALRVHREVGNKRAEAITLRNLANNYVARGLCEEACDHVCDAFRVSRACGDLAAEAALYSVLALVLYSLGRTEACLVAAERALQQVGQSGDVLMRYVAQTYRAQAFIATARAQHALPLLQENRAKLQPPVPPRLLVELALIPLAKARLCVAMVACMRTGAVPDDVLRHASAALSELESTADAAGNPAATAGYVAEARLWIERMRAGEVPACWFGVAPGGLEPMLRLSVVDQLAPDLRKIMQGRVPQVIEEMLAGTEGMRVPDWRDAALPVE